MKDSDRIALLAQFGLNEQESRVYLSLLELGSGTVGEIALRSGVKRTSIYNFIDRLVDTGVVIHGIGSRKRSYQATPPEEILAQQQHRVQLMEERIGELTEIMSNNGDKPRVTYYQGAKQMRRILDEQLHCHNTSLAIWPRAAMLPVFGGVKGVTAHDELRIKAKVFVRTIIVPEEAKVVHPLRREFNEVRAARPGSEFPMGLLVFDTGKVAFIHAGNEMFGFVIESNDLYRSMRFLFETLWAQSDPI